jgi:SAM-dependent methyltransferase
MKGGCVRVFLNKFLNADANRENWDRSFLDTLAAIPKGGRLLDAGAGELRNRHLCGHLHYVSQDACRYESVGDEQGLQMGSWDKSKIDLVCVIVDIPQPVCSFDVILCNEASEHLPDAIKALDKFSSLLKSGGRLVLTALFTSLVHFIPYHYVSSFSSYWYEYHLPPLNFEIRQLVPNWDWFDYLRQELFRLPRAARSYGDWCWPLAYAVAGLGLLYFSIRGKPQSASDLACFGWHCAAIKR